MKTAEQFLAELSGHLQGLIDEEQREFLVSEQGFWMDRRIRDEILLGMSPDEAEKLIVSKSGRPKTLAHRLAFEAYEDAVDTPIYNAIGRANVNANSVFGLMCGMYMVFLQMKNYMPPSNAIGLHMSPAKVREVFPAPLPYPDLSWQFFVTIGFPLIAPIIGGLICGRLIPVGAARAVYHVVALMALGCFLMGLLLLPETLALLFAAFLTLYWLPVGCSLAHFSSSVFRWQRRRLAERNGLVPSSPYTIKETHSQ